MRKNSRLLWIQCFPKARTRRRFTFRFPQKEIYLPRPFRIYLDYDVVKFQPLKWNALGKPA